MCGIGGVVSLTDRPPERSWGDLLVRELRHRGPDGEGVVADSRAVFAHTRLAIIDTSPAGCQPMESADKRHILLMNGEIYNHAALRPSLEQEGARFRSRSDTEVLLTLLARRGPTALASVLGMFAFAFYDRERGDLLLARDRLGKRPLFFVRTHEWFAFASEAAALLALPFVRAKIDIASVRSYLRFLYVPGPHTMLEGMEKLSPGATLSLRASTPGRPHAIARYWSAPAADPNASGRPDSRFFESLEQDLLDSTRLRTVSDVPIGVFLSGGIDSNTVLSLLHRVGHRPIRTFTVGFAGLSDERPLARLGADRYSDDHVELTIQPDVTNEVPQIIRRFGEPLGDSGIVTAYLIAREARRHVKVILNGDGGDELFGGYARYPFARRLDMAASIPLGVALARRFYRDRPQASAIFPALARHDMSGAAQIIGSVISPESEAGLVQPSILEAARPIGTDVSNRAGLTGAMFEWDTKAYLPDDLLYKVDVAPMSHALENRSPFLDHRLFERLATIPPKLRTDPFRTKPLLKHLVRDWIPGPVLEGKKRGFQLPIESWLHGPLRSWLDGLLLNADATGSLYRDGALQREVEAFHGGRSDPLAPYRLWNLATLELWARSFSVEIEASTVAAHAR